MFKIENGHGYVSKGIMSRGATDADYVAEIERLTRELEAATTTASVLRQMELDRRRERDALLAAVTEYVKELDNRFCDVSMRVTLRGRLRSLVLVHKQRAPEAEPIHGVGLYPV